MQSRRPRRPSLKIAERAGSAKVLSAAGDRRIVTQRSSSYTDTAGSPSCAAGTSKLGGWSRSAKGQNMRKLRSFASVALTSLAAATALTYPAGAQQPRPNIVVIMGDDIGWFNVGAYHQGMMAGRTPNL